jgi:hypothetical protein
MTADYRRTLEGIAQRYSPSQGLEDVAARRERRRRRARLTAGSGAMVLTIATAAFLVQSFGFFVEEEGTMASQESQQSATGVQEPVPPDCPEVEPGGYLATLSPVSATPGSTVAISGPAPFIAVDGTRRSPTENLAIEAWWNSDPSEWEDLLPGGAVPSPVGPGPAFFLAEQDVTGKCTFDFAFVVPDVPPGVYNVVLLVVASDSWSRYGIDAVKLNVTA